MAIVMKDIKKQYAGSKVVVMENFNLTIEEGSFRPAGPLRLR